MGFSTKGITNWSGGEASPSIYGRYDVSQYDALAEKIENYLITHYGSVLRTPGTKFVAKTKDMSKATRLIPFIFSEGQSYMLEFGHEYIRIYQNGGTIVETAVNISGATKADPCVITTSAAHGYSAGDAIDIESVAGMTELNNKRYLVANPTTSTFELQDELGVDIDSSGYTTYSSGGTCEKIYEVSSPYDADDVADIKYCQQADVMYLFHKDYPIRKLSRYGSATWTLTTITYDEVDFPPFLDINTSATTLTAGATTGTGVALVASTDTFDSDHVGAYFRVHEGTKPDGYVLITAVTDAQNAVCTVKSELGGTAGTTNWYEGAWSDYQGYPRDGKFYEQRLYCFSTVLKPLNVWGSVPGAFDDFWQPAAGEDTADDDALAYTIGSNQVDAILWAYPSGTLNLGTAGGPFTMSSGSSAEPITPTNVNVRQANENGASSVSPVRIGSFIYYVERSGKILGEFAYSLDYDVYETDNMTYLSDHILGTDGVVDMALQKYPYNVLWCVRDDGVVATFTRQSKNQIKGWSRQVFAGTDAEVENVAVIPNGTEDQVWLVIKRTINGATTRYVEYVMPHYFESKEDAFFVQSGLTYDDPITITNISANSAGTITVTAAGHGLTNGDKIRITDVVGMTELNNKYYYVSSATSSTFELVDSDGDDIDGSDYTSYSSGGEVRLCVTTISGLDHLEGETVQILADGAVLPDATVTSGSVTLTYSSALVHIGLGYDSELKTMDLNSGAVSGTSQDKVTHIAKVFVRFTNSLGGVVGNGTVMDTIRFRSWGDAMDASPDLFSGDKPVMFPSDHVKNKYIYIKQTQPLPQHVLGLFPRMLVSE